MASIAPLTTPQVEADIVSINLNVSSHSIMLSLTMFTVNDFDNSSAATPTVLEVTL